MPIDLLNCVKNTCDSSFSSKGAISILSNRIYTAGILTVIILIIIFVIYPCKENTPYNTIFKLGLYSFIACAVVIISHDCVMQNVYKSNYEKKTTDDIIMASTGDNNIAFGGSDMMPVNIKINRDNYSENLVDNTKTDPASILDIYGV